MLQQKQEYHLLKKGIFRNKLIKMNDLEINLLKKQIKLLDELMEETFEKNKELHQQVQRIRIIPSIGKVLSSAIIAKTEGFNLYDEP